jgi:NAD(P)-dependent dehydrogenase (short-subunit alcohol dehydrogenase family)
MAKFVVITGATRGLGRALCDRFAEAGWTIAGCGTKSDLVKSAATELGAPHRISKVDTTDAAAVETWAKKLISEVGAPDLLVNNAGVINENAPLWDVPIDEFARVIDVNVSGVFHVIRAFVPGMINKKSGVIVNLSSGWGRSTSPDVAPYCASKWAIEGLTQSLSHDLPKGLAAVALNPGIIDTEMLRSTFGSGAGHYPSPEKWSRNAAPFLMGLTSRHNGQALTVPGIPT